MTIHMLNWLESNGWEIICYDFPQSGTGVLIHPNISEKSSKNKNGFIPDIVARKKSIVLFFENKDRYFHSDFVKLKEIKNDKKYTKGITELIYPSNLSNIFYGIGIYNNKKNVDKSLNNINDLDFLLSVNDDGSINIDYESCKIFD